MKFKMEHENYNVADLERSLAFYEKALGLTEVRRNEAEDGSFIIVYIANDQNDFQLELTYLTDRTEPYDLGEQEFHLALMTDDISKLPYLQWLSRATVSTIKAAITLSMCINFVAITLSVLGILTPTTGALVHNAGSCFVVLLAALLYDRKYK